VNYNYLGVTVWFKMHYVVCAPITADCIDGCSQADGLYFFSNRDVLAWSYVTWRRTNQERRWTGEHCFRVNAKLCPPMEYFFNNLPL